MALANLSRSPYGLAGELLIPPRQFVNTFLTRTLPLLVCIAVGSAISWVSIYVFWFAIWIFHSVPAARAADAVGSFLLLPGRYVFQWSGGNQSSIFYDPISFSGTNGLVLGLIFYSIFRAIWTRRTAKTENAHTNECGHPVIR